MVDRPTIYDYALPTPADRKRLREEVGLSVTDLAEVVGCSRGTIYKWEKDGGAQPSGLYRIAYVCAIQDMTDYLTKPRTPHE